MKNDSVEHYIDAYRKIKTESLADFKAGRLMNTRHGSWSEYSQAVAQAEIKALRVTLMYYASRSYDSRSEPDHVIQPDAEEALQDV